MKTLPVILLALCAFAAEPGKPFFENDEVRVFRALEKSHVKGNFHEHKVNRVMIYLHDGKQHFDFKDGRPGVDVTWKKGQIEWSKPEGLHQPENTGAEDFNIIEIEIKKPAGPKGPAPSDALKADPKHYKPELDNDQVRIFRVKLGPNEKAKKVTRTHNQVVVYFSGKRAGEAVWETAGSGQLENTGDQPAEIIVVELKS